jgi:hypothetical protein
MTDPRSCYCQRGDAPMVAVPAEGAWLVIDGEATEVERVHYGYGIYMVGPKEEDDDV